MEFRWDLFCRASQNHVCSGTSDSLDAAKAAVMNEAARYSAVTGRVMMTIYGPGQEHYSLDGDKWESDFWERG